MDGATHRAAAATPMAAEAWHAADGAMNAAEDRRIESEVRSERDMAGALGKEEWVGPGFI